MKKKGFTLIELLAVIIIISVLVTISSLSVSKLVKKSKAKLSNYQKESIIDSARIIINDNLAIVDIEGECKYISLSYIIKYGVIDENIVNSIGDQNLHVKVCLDGSSAYNEDKLTYEIVNNIDGLEPIFNE